MATPVVREAITASDYVSGTPVATGITGSGTQVDDLLVAFMGLDYAYNAGGVDFPAPTGTSGLWSPATTVTGPGGDIGSGTPWIVIWTRRVTVAGAQTVSVTAGARDSGAHLNLYVLPGTDTASPVSDAASSSGNSASWVAPSVNAAGSDDLLLCCWQSYYENAGPPTIPTSMNTAVTAPVAADAVMRSARQALTSSGATGTRTATTSANRYASASIAIRGASGGGSGSPVLQRAILRSTARSRASLW